MAAMRHEKVSSAVFKCGHLEDLTRSLEDIPTLEELENGAIIIGTYSSEVLPEVEDVGVIPSPDGILASPDLNIGLRIFAVMGKDAVHATMDNAFIIQGRGTVVLVCQYSRRHIIGEDSATLSTVSDHLPPDLLRPAIGTACPMGQKCDIDHYLQDCTILRHFTDQEVMIAQHITHHMANMTTELFEAATYKKLCTCTRDRKCNIKVSLSFTTA